VVGRISKGRRRGGCWCRMCAAIAPYVLLENFLDET
jgi:hypothetical protein